MQLNNTGIVPETKNLAKIYAVKDEFGTIIGGITFLIYKDKVYEYYIHSDRKFGNFHASEIATYQPILWGSKNKVRIYDMMGAGKPNIDYGVRDFKMGFGGDLVEYGRFKKVHNYSMYLLIFTLLKGYTSLKAKIR